MLGILAEDSTFFAGQGGGGGGGRRGASDTVRVVKDETDFQLLRSANVSSSR